ncbi:hypothetical protein [Streptococcus pluranimalium]|uniref:hypothetical protein n=1 Tax=Streptococcus pluranimalium TaxID=82348 RepID=UPI0040470303
MIDYYKGIDLATGKKLSYLLELSGKIKQEDSASDIYETLVALGEELDNRETLGNFTEDSRALSRVLPNIKRHFLSEKWKTTYDYQLVQYYLNQSEPKETATETTEENYPMPIEEPMSQATIEPIQAIDEESSVQESHWWQKWFLQLVIVLVTLAMMIFLDLDTSLVLVILLVVVTVSLFLSN